MQNISWQKLTTLIVTVCFCWLSFLAHANDDEIQSEQEARERLEQVQQQIQKRQQQLKQKNQKLANADQAIRKTDLLIGNTAKVLRKTESQLKQVKRDLIALEAKAVQLEQDKAKQLTAFAAQIRSAYQLGEHDYLMMLLNQENVGKLERVLTYYQYLNKARMDAIDTLKQTLADIEITKVSLSERRADLARLLAEQLEQKNQLAAQKRTQKKQQKQLKTLVKTEKQKIDRLKQNENALTEALDALIAAVEALPIIPAEFESLSDLKGKLSWPTKGRLQKLFGKRKRGPLRWKGVMIDAAQGQEIYNIHVGQVIFADWMKGYGLVMVVDHGDGFMSLYGHNQTLLKEVGDRVESGETVALVGQSGGENYPNLYFELRHEGKPLNPSNWFRR